MVNDSDVGLQQLAMGDAREDEASDDEAPEETLTRWEEDKNPAARKRLEDALRKGDAQEILAALKAARGLVSDEDPLMRKAEQNLVQAAFKDDKLMKEMPEEKR